MLQFLRLACALSILAACAPIPRDALILKQEALSARQLQTRWFNTRNESELLSAAAALIQDLGFVIEEAETKLGVIVGSKQRDATDAGQIASQIAIAAVLGTQAVWDTEQRIRISVVTHPKDRRNTALRVTFQRTVWNSQGVIARTEAIDDPKVYQEFFDKLSKAVFLEANQI